MGPPPPDRSLVTLQLLPNEDGLSYEKVPPPPRALLPTPPSLFAQLSGSGSSPTSLQREASGSCRTLPSLAPSSKVLTTVRDLNLACGASGWEDKVSHHQVVWLLEPQWQR